MTPLQQAYLNKLHAMAMANIEFFKLNMAAVHAVVARESPAATLDISDQGDLTVRYPDGTTKAYAQHMVEEEARLAEFEDLERRPQLLAFQDLRAVQENPSHGDMQRYHYSNLDQEYSNRVREHFVKHYPDNAGLLRYPVFGGPRDIPLLIVCGSGLGTHLTRLVSEYNIRYLVVLEPDAEAFRLSIFFQDYIQLSRLAMEKGTDLAFIVGADIAHLARGLMSVLRRSLPPFFVHGAALFYAMPQGDLLESIKSTVMETLWQMFFGLGYFDDELICVRHTMRNLANRLPVYTRAGCVTDPEAVAFIVGSGPSLDGLLPFLRANRERAVVFSCGTALGPLSHAGIIPDFHLEKERPGIVYDVLTRTVPADFLKQTHLLALNVVMPEVFALFGKATMVIKDVDTMGLLLEQYCGLKRIVIDSQPTVTNLALSLATTMGFKRAFLLGVDMGYKDTEQHHSRQTAYLGKLPEAEHLRRLLTRKPSQERTLPGNFGGEVTTSNILEMARQHLEAWIHFNPQITVYNLNDGAFIQGAVPTHIGDIPQLPDVSSRLRALTAIHDAFTHEDIDLAHVRCALIEEIDRFISGVEAGLQRSYTTRQDVIDMIVDYYRVLVCDEINRSTPASAMFRGLVLMLMSLAYNTMSIIEDDEEAVAKVQYDLGNLLDSLTTARAEVVNTLESYQ
jgi:hypothetical protein